MGSATSKPPAPVTVPGRDEEKTALTEVLSNLHLAPASQDGSLDLVNISSWESALEQDPKAQLSRTILSHTNITESLLSRKTIVGDKHVFNLEIDFKTGPITNQKSSGRCWLFATTNVLRYDIMKRLKLKEFELSQSYLFFWDKLNKANYYLELTIQHADLPVDDRLITHLAGDLISDGGQYDMAVNILEKYGIVPQAVYPESTHSSLSGPLNALLKTKLREHSLILRRLYANFKSQAFSEQVIQNSLRAEKEKLLKEVYTIMTATLGVPPLPDQKFVWDYNDADGKFGRWEGTPLEYFQTFGTKPYSPKDAFSLINDPRNEYSKLYTVDKLGNVWNGRPVLYVNTEIENMKAMVIKMIKAGLPVFFGCDVGKFYDRTTGVMDPELFAYENAFDIKLGLTKAERLQIGESAMTHAMVISGVYFGPDGKPQRYKVENSWSESVGNSGYFVMTDKWFEEFVYQIVVPKALAPKELAKIFDSGDAIVLPPWDPMGGHSGLSNWLSHHTMSIMLNDNLNTPTGNDARYSEALGKVTALIKVRNSQSVTFATLSPPLSFTMTDTTKPMFKLSFFGMVAAVMAALKLKEYFDKNNRSGEGRIALEGEEDETVSMLNTQLPSNRAPGRRRTKTCCVCCGLNCALFCKALGIVTALLVCWYTLKFVIWALTPSPTGLENMPEYSSSLGCLNAPYRYNDGQEKVINIPLSTDFSHSLDISGDGVGTVVIHSGAPQLTEVQYKIAMRSDDEQLLEQVTFGSSTPGYLRIATPSTSSSCLRYDLEIFLPSNLKSFEMESQTPSQIKFGELKQDQVLERVTVALFGGNTKDMILPSANLTAKELTLEVYRGWIVGEATVVDNLSVTTEKGDGTTNIRVHPLAPQDPRSLQTAQLKTLSGSGRTDIFFIGDKAVSHRPISSSHTASRDSSELYLTYREADFSGLVSLKSRSFSARGLHPFSSTQWTHWVSSQDGVDRLSVKNEKGWTGLYF